MNDLRSLRAAVAVVCDASARVVAVPNADIMIEAIVERLLDLAGDIECWIEAEEASE